MKFICRSTLAVSFTFFTAVASIATLSASPVLPDSNSPRHEDTRASNAAPLAGASNSNQSITVDQVNQSLGLRASKIVELQVDPTPDRAQTINLTIDNQPSAMLLAPHSVRAAGYRLREQIADGSIIDVDPGPNRMLRGTLAGIPGSQVAGGLLDDGLYAVVMLPDGQGGMTRRWIEPLISRIPGARANQYAMYRSEDVIHPHGFCGTDAANLLGAQDMLPLPTAPGTDGVGVHCTELACDADVEYYQHYGSNVITVQNRINLVINTMNLQYINEVSISHVITQIIVRTAEPDPYTSTDPNSLLNQFRSEWLNNQAAVPRDVAQLYTGKNVDGTVIGIAYTIGGICNTNAYCLVQSDCCGGLACSTDLSAHELGHLWGASHCTSACNSTMNPSITCINTFNNSNPDSVAAIVAYRNTRSCLSACADATLPFFDDFPTTTLDPAKWTTVSGAIVDTVGVNEPSPTLSLRLRGSSTGGNEVRTSRIDASGLSQMQLTYSYERTGGGNQPEPNDDLIVEYFNNTGGWTEISRQLGNGPAMTTYVPVTVEFPSDAMHSEFRVRFRVSSFQNNQDDWFVDNVGIDGVAAPVNDNCSSALLKLAGSYSFTTLGATTDGPDEPGMCNFDGFSQIDRDIWYKFIAQCTGTATVSLCGANYDAKLAIYTDACPSTGSSIACNDDFCGLAPQVSFPVNSGSIYRIRIGGVNNATGSGTMVISCSPLPQCTGDANNDGQVNVADMLLVINAWGSCSQCPADMNHDGQVNVADLLLVINSWGACP